MQNSKEVINHGVLVVGDFSKGGFAQTSWDNIYNIYQGGDKSLPHASRASGSRKVRKEPSLYPVKLDDRGNAGSLSFRKMLYSLFQTYNIWAIISCCTARNSALLLKALKPIDVPILICVDNTVERSAQASPSVLQLIPNNALQAQAILGRVAAELPSGTQQHTVNVYCRRPEDEYVKDLWTALRAKGQDSQNRRILLKEITVGEILHEACASLNEDEIIVYIGYYDGLDRLLRETSGKRLKLLLCDGCHEQVAQDLMADSNELWYVAVPSFDPRVYAYQAYISISEVWRNSFPPQNDDSIEERVSSITSRIQKDMVKNWKYRFVGVANQSGGYLLKYGNTHVNAPH